MYVGHNGANEVHKKKWKVIFDIDNVAPISMYNYYILTVTF